MWCKTCRYGSEVAKFTRCPQCGNTHYVDVKVMDTVDATGKPNKKVIKQLVDGQTDKCPFKFKTGNSFKKKEFDADVPREERMHPSLVV